VLQCKTKIALILNYINYINSFAVNMCSIRINILAAEIIENLSEQSIEVFCCQFITLLFFNTIMLINIKIINQDKTFCSINSKYLFYMLQLKD